MGTPYASCAKLLAEGSAAWVSATYRVLLVGPTYTWNINHKRVTDVSAHELSSTGTNYSRQTLANKSTVHHALGLYSVLYADPVTFLGLTACTPSGAVVFKRGGADDLTPVDDVLLVFIPLPGDPATGRNYTLEFLPGVLMLEPKI